jgi:hypothetical protein
MKKLGEGIEVMVFETELIPDVVTKSLEDPVLVVSFSKKKRHFYNSVGIKTLGAKINEGLKKELESEDAFDLETFNLKLEDFAKKDFPIYFFWVEKLYPLSESEGIVAESIFDKMRPMITRLCGVTCENVDSINFSKRDLEEESLEYKIEEPIENIDLFKKDVVLSIVRDSKRMINIEKHFTPEKKGYYLDLHCEQIMKRKDGSLVYIDAFYP